VAATQKMDLGLSVIAVTASRWLEQDTSLAPKESGGEPYKSLEKAKTRLRQVEYFKHISGVN
jgi:hypothetical protein